MRCVILRDDDTNALTPIECLERLYRPFLERGMPVNLATIPEVHADARTPEGKREEFVELRALMGAATKAVAAPVKTRLSDENRVPLAENRALVEYLHSNLGYAIVQHGCHHDPWEFDRSDRSEIVRRIERGRMCLREAGFADVRAFVAPHDRLSRVAYAEVAKRFSLISTGWFTWRRLPMAWWPRYAMKKLLGQPHWSVNGTRLLSHPGCLLSYQRNCDTMLDEIVQVIARNEVTVLVTHWWEYFRDGVADEAFIAVLHRVADYLAGRPDIRVTTFDAFVAGREAHGARGFRPHLSAAERALKHRATL